MPRSTRAKRHCRPLALLFVLLAGVIPLAAQEVDRDFESRVDYAFYTENVNSLRTLIRDATAAIAKGGGSAAAHYQLAFAYYRLGNTLGRKHASTAAGAMSSCVDALDEALENDPEDAEALALQSACYGRLASLRTMTAMINGPLSGAKLEKARELAPENPRVMLADGLADYWRPRAFGGDRPAAIRKLRRAVELFDTAAGEPGAPRWGHADACMALGQSLHDAKDTIGARNALERALMVAPDYAAARRLLAKVTGAR